MSVAIGLFHSLSGGTAFLGVVAPGSAGDSVLLKRPSFLQPIQIRENLDAVFERIDGGIRLRNFAGWVDQESVARGKFHHSKIGQRSVRVGHFVFAIRKQLEVQALFGAKLFV